MAFITMRVPASESEKSETAIGNFLNGQLHMQDARQLNVGYYEAKAAAKTRKRRMMVAESERMYYVGSTDGALTNSAPSNARYFLGVMDKKTATMNIYKTSMFNLKPTTTVSLPEDSLDGENPLSYMEQMDRLTTSFGSRVKKRAMASRHRNKISGDALDTAVSSAVTDAMTQPEFQNSMVSAANQDSASVIPEYNINATKPQDVYPLQNIIGTSEMDALKTPAAAWINGSNQDAESEYHYVQEHLRIMPLQANARCNRACQLMYLCYLISFYKMSYKDIAKKAPLPLDIPEPVRKLILDSFTLISKTGNKVIRYRPMRMRDKIVSYILVLCLIIDDFTLQFPRLQRDLQLTDQKLSMYVKALGCKVTRKPVPGEHASTINIGVATLNTPVQFPEPNLKQKKERR